MVQKVNYLVAHYHLHKHLSKKNNHSLLDTIVLTASYLYPLSGVPQLLLVYKGEVSGVSVASWLAFACFSALFLIYGLVNKIKPMIVVNILWLTMDILIVFGTLVHRMSK